MAARRRYFGGLTVAPSESRTTSYIAMKHHKDLSEWDAEIAKGFRSNIPAIVAAHVGIFGIKTFPSWPRTKRPRAGGWQQAATCDAAKIMRWHRAYEGPDFIVPTGRENGLWIVDVDGKRGRARYAELVAKYGPLPRTPTVETGRTDGGFHLWLRPTPDGPDLKSVGKALIDGRRDCIDQKGRGGYAVLPGSLHASRAKYRWAEGCAPDECELASLPDAWLEIMDWADARPSGENTLTPSARRARGVIERQHDPASTLIGDGAGYGGFQDPIYRNAIRFFLKAGIAAPETIIIDTLREMIAEAPKDEDRDVSRYMDGNDLPRLVKRAREYVKQVKEEQ
jgi:hypothetical protein